MDDEEENMGKPNDEDEEASRVLLNRKISDKTG